MKNTINIILFFDEEGFYNPAKVASEIVGMYEEIKEPIILPINDTAPENANIPYLIFSQNEDFQIISNFKQLSISLCNKYIDRMEEIVENVYNVYAKDNSFVRVGYSPMNILPKKSVLEFKEKNFKKQEVIDSIDFQLAWFTNIKILDNTINCWERYMTNHENFEGLMVNFDFNTDSAQETNVNKEYIIDFIRECNTYKDKKINIESR